LRHVGGFFPQSLAIPFNDRQSVLNRSERYNADNTALQSNPSLNKPDQEPFIMAIDIYLQIEGIKGESQDDKHKE